MSPRVPLFIFLIAAAGCGGGMLYPDTDVVEPSGMKLLVATGPMRPAGGVLQSGVLEYEGEGELNPVFRAYIEAMKGRGWTHSDSEVKGDRATGTLTKDRRNCALQFTNSNGKIRVIITVTQSK